KQSGQPALNRDRVEPGRDRQDGVAALSRALPVLCPGRRVELPALSTQLRFVSRGAVQYCVLCVAHDDGGASCRSYPGRFCPHVRRPASLPKPSRPGARTTHSRLSTFTADELESRG